MTASILPATALYGCWYTSPILSPSPKFCLPLDDVNDDTTSGPASPIIALTPPEAKLEGFELKPCCKNSFPETLSCQSKAFFNSHIFLDLAAFFTSSSALSVTFLPFISAMVCLPLNAPNILRPARTAPPINIQVIGFFNNPSIFPPSKLDNPPESFLFPSSKGVKVDSAALDVPEIPCCSKEPSFACSSFKSISLC